MNTAQLEAFLAVADTLSFAQAAKRLHVTQPAVTHQIRSLEAELGVTLFNRTTRRVRLTEEGRLLIIDAESIVQTARRAQGRFRKGNAARPLALRVGCRSYAHMMSLAGTFRALAAGHPGLHPDLVAVAHDHLHQLLQDGEVDAVLDFEGAGRPGERFSALADVAIGCLCPPESPLAAREALWPEDLAGEPLALTRPDHIPERLRHETARLMARQEAGEPFLCDSAESALVLVLAGLAVSVQPMLSIPPETDLAVVPMGGTEPIAFGVYTLGKPAALVEEFIARAREDLAGSAGPRAAR